MSDETDRQIKVSPWGALAYRDFRYFWTHGVLQGISRNMRDMLAFFLVYEISGSAVQLGITGLFQAVPIIVLGLLGGALADSMNRKTLLVVSQLANLFSAALLTVLAFAGLVEVWHLWMMAGFWSAVNSLGRPAQRAYVPRLVPATHVVNAITWYGALQQGTLFIGPIMAGFLAALVGISWAFAVNVVVLVMALIATLMIRVSGEPETAQRGVSLRTIWEGVQFVRLQQVLLAAFILDFGVMSFGFLRPLMPVLAADVYHVGEVGLGVLNAATAVGSVLGTFALLMMGEVPRKGIVIILAYLSYAAGLALLGLSPWFAMALVALTWLGFMDVVSFTLKQALIQVVAPDRFRGRAASLSSILSQLGNATGAMEMGALAAVVGAPAALIINCFVGLSVTGIVGSRWPQLWRHGGMPEPVPAPATD